MDISSLERRANPRIDINGEMTYSREDANDFLRGDIENMSAAGARIWIELDLPADSRLIVRVAANEPDEAPLEFVATLLHRLPERKGLCYGYGCNVEAR